MIPARILGGLGLCAALTAAPATGGISVSIHPESIYAEPGELFTAYVWIDSTGSPFNGYECLLRFAPELLTCISAQQESLMTGLCGVPPWWSPVIGADSILISHVAMCGPLTITGPGALSSVTFETRGPGESEIVFDFIEFYDAGEIVPDVGARDGRVICTARSVCCLADSCLLAFAGECAALGGSWHPDQSSCNPNPCAAGLAVDAGDLSAVEWVRVQPNPASALLSFALSDPVLAPVRITIFDCAGRAVRRLAPGQLSWNTRDATGQRVPPGLYGCRIAGPQRTVWRRVLILR